MHLASAQVCSEPSVFVLRNLNKASALEWIVVLESDFSIIMVWSSSPHRQVSFAFFTGFVYWCFRGRLLFPSLVNKWCGTFAFVETSMMMRRMSLHCFTIFLALSIYLLTGMIIRVAHRTPLGFSQLSPFFGQANGTLPLVLSQLSSSFFGATNVTPFLLLIQPSGLVKLPLVLSVFFLDG